MTILQGIEERSSSPRIRFREARVSLEFQLGCPFDSDIRKCRKHILTKPRGVHLLGLLVIDDRKGFVKCRCTKLFERVRLLRSIFASKEREGERLFPLASHAVAVDFVGSVVRGSLDGSIRGHGGR